MSDVDSVAVENRSHGQIRTHEWKDGLTTYSLRVRAYGRREVVTLATAPTGGRTARPSASSSRSSRRFRSACGGRRACPPAAMTRPSISSRRGGGSCASPSFGRQRRPTTSGGCGSICCHSSRTSRSLPLRSRSSTRTAARRSSSVSASRPRPRLGGRYATSADSGVLRSATSRSTDPCAPGEHPRHRCRARTAREQPGARQATPAEGGSADPSVPRS